MAHSKHTETTAKGDRIIVIPLEKSDYDKFSENACFARQTIDKAISDTPELFPESARAHYKLNGHVKASAKTGYRLRTIRNSKGCWRIYPSFLLPYMRGETEDVSDALFLCRWVPFWALAVVFGRDSMFWYRLFSCISSKSIVGTSVQKDTAVPVHLVADEEHLSLNGEKVYCATTAASGCLFGAETALSCGEEALRSAYGVFREEALALAPCYSPETVNLDGWQAGNAAWLSLFPKIAVIACFLHSFIKVRDRALKKMKAVFDSAADKIWDCYRACDKRAFSQKIRRLKEWAEKNVPDSPMKDNINKLCDKSRQFQVAYDFPEAYRTSNTVDRLMKFMDRFMTKNMAFHGKSIEVATKTIRAFALIYNFSPSCPDNTRESSFKSPVARFNNHEYHKNWLANLLIAGSLNGKRQRTTKTI